MSDDAFAALPWQKALTLVAEAFDDKVFKDLGNKVLDGPFKGMIIPEKTIWEDGNNSCKLLGNYEHELIPAIERAISRCPRYVINHGCADGYYAIGLARRLLDAHVIAIDCRMECVNLCCEYAKLNNIPGNQLTVLLGSDELQNLTESGHRLYVVDVEGAEVKVLDTQLTPSLVHSDIIVECHDFEDVEPTSNILLQRFKDTHEIEVVHPQLPPVPALLNGLPVIIQLLLAADKRPLGSFWLVCFAKSYQINTLWDGLKKIGFEDTQ